MSSNWSAGSLRPLRLASLTGRDAARAFVVRFPLCPIGRLGPLDLGSPATRLFFAPDVSLPALDDLDDGRLRFGGVALSWSLLLGALERRCVSMALVYSPCVGWPSSCHSLL